MPLHLPVEDTFQRLLAQEDTDGDRQITVRDEGPGRFVAQPVEGPALTVEGVYQLSNLLQELALAREAGLAVLVLDPDRLTENPVRRISRMIRDYYWDGLTRRIDAAGLARIVVDTKNAGDRARLYVPATDTKAQAYFTEVARAQPDLNLEVVTLPKDLTPEYVRRINDRPGVLGLALRQDTDGRTAGVPFVVPGGRFNEMYGWDSYFEALGLLQDGRVDLARAMVDNFVYEITHYGQILNANRSYYLTRSQPPFLTSMALAVYEHLPAAAPREVWLKTALQAAILEYETVWMNPHRLTETGLSRYCGSGIGMPPETEEGHFDAVLAPYAEQAGLNVRTYARRYLAREITDPALDAYFVHDRAVRESGHDTSYRLEDRAAHLNTVDLNALLYKYETDLAEAITTVFGDALGMPDGTMQRSDAWRQRAVQRKLLMKDLCWDEAQGVFSDYDFVEKKQTGYESVTMLYPLWAGLLDTAEAARLVSATLPLFEVAGGLVSCTEASRGAITSARPQRQWDYPFGWPPHQMLAWVGLVRYGFEDDARRLAYRWLLMLTKNAADYNGTIPEKYDVVNRTHRVFVEYGNVGTEFDYITREGFGWMNASYQVGLALLTPEQRAHLEALDPVEEVFG